MPIPLRVLILEGQPADAELMLHELRLAGFDPDWQRVETESDYLAHLDPALHLILADYHLPSFGALRALQHLQARGLDIPLIIVTGSISEEVAVACMKQGAADYLLKDRLTRLGSAVANALKQRQLRAERERAQEALAGRILQQAAIAGLGERALAGIDLSKLFDEAVALVAQTIEVEYAEVLELLPDGTALLLRAGVGWKEGCVGHAKVEVGTKSQAGYTLLAGELVVFEDFWTETRFSGPSLLREHGVVSGMSVIIHGKDRSFGVLGAHTTRRRTFTQDDRHFLQAIANVLAAAIKRRQAEEQLRLQSAALEAAANGIVITDREGCIVWVNPAYTRLTGYGAEEAIGQNPRLLKSGKHDQAFYQDLWETILSGRVWAKETINRRKDGSLYTEAQTITPVRDERGEITHFIAIKQDITDRKQAEEIRQALYQLGKLLSRSLQLEEVYPAFAEVVRTVVPYDRICVVVPKEESLVTALSVADPPLCNRQGYVWPQRANTAVEWVMAHKTPRLVRDLAKEQAFADEALIAKEGVRTTLFLPLLVGGEAMGVFTVDSRTPGAYSDRHVELLRLVTEQLALALQNALLFTQVAGHAKELEQRVETRTRDLQVANVELQEAMRIAEEASRHKSAFLSHMSHELRTPLNSILGFAELLQDQAHGELSAKQARFVDHVHTSGQHLLALINDLLDLSKVEAGKLELRSESFVLPEAIAAALRVIQPQADLKRLQLQLDVAEAPVTLHADPVRLTQILFNLLSNAVKFTPEGGQITVTAKVVPRSECQVPGLEPGTQHLKRGIPKSPDFVEISVADTGIGITAEDLPKLFQPFTQLEASFTKRHQGTGLGLALTKQLVELHGGSISATSPGDGQGSTFTVRLPLG